VAQLVERIPGAVVIVLAGHAQIARYEKQLPRDLLQQHVMKLQRELERHLRSAE